MQRHLPEETITVFTVEPSRVIMIRHAEKSEEKNDQRLQMPKGYERAGALAPFLAFKFKIDVLYAPRVGPESHSHRLIETLTPLSMRLDLPITANYSNSKEDIREMVKFIQTNPNYHRKTVLICWHHDKIPFLAKEFKPTNVNQVPDKWPKHRFDVLWILKKTSKGLVFCQEPQKLLFDDKTYVIPLKK